MFKNDLPIFVPNEIFKDFAELKYTSNRHYSFTICYYILISYLYYYSFYGINLLKKNEINKLLRISPSNQRYNYIINKNGLLDKSGYTSTTSKIPVLTKVNSRIPFFIFNDSKVSNINNNYAIKCPIKGFYRNKEDKELTGTFFNTSNTICLDMNIFFKIINNCGINALVVYLFIKKYNKLMMGYSNIANNLLMSNRLVFEVIKLLEFNNYITVNHAHYDYSDNFRMSNVYFIASEI